MKVFRTPIGFHDAFVAAPSRKAALEAWGAGTDLFSAKIAEEVKDHGAEAAQEALAKPGEIVRAKRIGGEDTEPGDAPTPRSPPLEGRGSKKQEPKPKPKPRPSRAALDKAEKVLARLEEKHAVEQAELEKEEARLADRRRALDKKHREALEKAEAQRDEADYAFRKALKEWVN